MHVVDLRVKGSILYGTRCGVSWGLLKFLEGVFSNDNLARRACVYDFLFDQTHKHLQALGNPAMPRVCPIGMKFAMKITVRKWVKNHVLKPLE